MSYRRLASVFGLTLCDYALWNWSLNANHDVLALVSGLTLPPLALACLWMLAVSLLRMLGSSGRRAKRRRVLNRASAARRLSSEAAAGGRTATAAGRGHGGSSSSTGRSRSSSGKLAA